MGTLRTVSDAVDGTDGLVRAAGALPSVHAGALALALALGRVAGRWGLSLDDLLEVARAGRDAGDVSSAAAPLLPDGRDLN
jgi:hypothetical protein